MRTVVDLEENLVRRARRLTGIKKKVDLVNTGLQTLIRQKEIEQTLELAGKIRWKGNHNRMRHGR